MPASVAPTEKAGASIKPDANKILKIDTYSGLISKENAYVIN
jgi:hypothetical protein